jgi:hypothetical protein
MGSKTQGEQDDQSVNTMNELIRDELLAMDAEDHRVRQELSNEGALGDGYYPLMESVHTRNAARLKEIISQHGWPGRALVGDEGAFAAWRIAQHAIGDPPFQRLCLRLLDEATVHGDVSPQHPAYLLDRIRMYEGKPQIYGTQFMPNEEGYWAPWKIEDPEHVEERRSAIGLRPLAELLREPDPSSRPSRERLEAWSRGYDEWLRKTGWRE